jgi:transposase
MWALEYIRDNGRSRWREGKEIGLPSQRFNSPYDPEAHHGMKGTRSWDGYKVHFTETCESDTPNLVTHVMTTPTTVTDLECTQRIQEAVNAKGSGVGEHLVDSGYVSAKLLISSRDRGVKLIGPPRPRQGCQAHTEGAFDISRFKVNFKRHSVTCPRKKKSASWVEKPRKG